jgi:hypothetical protein
MLRTASFDPVGQTHSLGRCGKVTLFVGSRWDLSRIISDPRLPTNVATIEITSAMRVQEIASG